MAKPPTIRIKRKVQTVMDMRQFELGAVVCLKKAFRTKGRSRIWGHVVGFSQLASITTAIKVRWEHGLITETDPEKLTTTDPDDKREPLKTIEEHNAEVDAFLAKRIQTGLACPSCGFELKFADDSMNLSYPPTRVVRCEGCNWSGRIK